MPRYIDADLLRAVVIACSVKQGCFTVDDILMMIDAVKPADVEEVKHGRWIEDGDVQICSECGEEHEWADYRAAYCEDCGAKMDGKENEDGT